MLVITGGAGFIGSALLWRLNELGESGVLVVDDLGHSEKWRNLVKRKYLDYMHKSEFIDHVRRNTLPFRPRAIAHLGACSSTIQTDANYLMENNFHYSRDLCRFALENDIRFINASSAATYGAGEHGFSDATENIGKLRPLNMYGYSKQLFDLWLLDNKLEDKVVSLKFFNVYGPNEYHKGDMRSVAVKLFGQIGATGCASLFASTVPGLADGDQKRDFVYVKDCARMLAWLLDGGNRVYGVRNVGSGVANSFNDLAKAIFQAMGKPVNIKYIPMPEKIAQNYQSHTCADMAWLKEKACPVEFADLATGINDYTLNYLAKSDRYL